MREIIVLACVLLASCGIVQPEDEPVAVAQSVGIVQPPPSCANVASGRSPRIHKMIPAAMGGSFGSGVFQNLSGVGPTGNWLPRADGDTLVISVPVEAGERIESIDTSVLGDPQSTVGIELRRNDNALSTGLSLGVAFDVSTKTTQTVSLVPTSIEDVDGTVASYWVRIRVSRAAGASPDNQSVIGPMVVRTSVLTVAGSAPSC